MRRPISLLHVVRWLDTRTLKPGLSASRLSVRVGLSLAASLFLVSILFSACSGGDSSSTQTPTPSSLALNKISWCGGKAAMVFRDEGAVSATVTPQATATGTATATTTPATGAGTPHTITDWSVVKANLGFTVYLPSTLPNGSCLVSAQATIHDPIFGGNFTIGYLLPDHTSLSISEAPLKSQNVSFQCNPTNTTPTTGKKGSTPTASATQAPNQLCSGAKDTTNIVISGPGSADHLQQIFNSLQSDVNWIPAS